MTLADRMRAKAQERWAEKGPEYAQRREQRAKEQQAKAEKKARAAEAQERARQEAWRHFHAQQQQRQQAEQNTYRIWEDAFGFGRSQPQPQTKALSKERVKVIDRIQKLLRLAAGGTTAEESRTAATAAYKLIEEHRIEFR
jgi:hypothetical protein